MINSLYRIEFLDGTRSILLLDYGQMINEELALPVSIKATDYNATGADWGDGIMEGAAKRSLSWQTRRDHASHRAVRSFCMSHAELMPKQARGLLRVSIIDADGVTSSPEIWELASARILAVEVTTMTATNGYRSLTAYRVETGSARPISIIDPFPGMPLTWYNQTLTSLTQPLTSY